MSLARVGKGRDHKVQALSRTGEEERLYRATIHSKLAGLYHW